MKFLYTAIFVFIFSTFAFSQRVANAYSSSDFKTLKGGFVESVFTFNEPLSAQESANIIQWAKANEPNVLITVTPDNKQLTLQLTADYNQKALYDKMFYQISVENITVYHNGQPVALSKEAFFEKFNF